MERDTRPSLHIGELPCKIANLFWSDSNRMLTEAEVVMSGGVLVMVISVVT